MFANKRMSIVKERNMSVTRALALELPVAAVT